MNITRKESRSTPSMLWRSAALGAVGILGLTACGGGDGGDESSADETFNLTYTTYSNDTSDQSLTVQRWAEEVEELTDGGVTVDFHYSESLVGAEESLQATIDGRADMAQVGSLYAASDLPMYTVSELPFETDNPEAQMVALDQLYQENDAYRGDFEQQGVQQLFPLPIGIAVVGLNEPAETPDDLSGLSIRSGGVVSEAMIGVGANPVSMTATDVYESMERGVIDGYTSLGIANLSTFGLSESTAHVLEPGIGSYASSVVVVNQELVDSMPEDYQEALRTASENAVGYGLEELDTLGNQACEELQSSGTEFSSFAEEDVTAWQEESGIAEAWVADQGGDAESVLEDYRQFIDETTESSDYSDPLVACMGE